MRVFVVDDEAPARRRLMRMLAEVPDVTVVGESEDCDGLAARVDAASAELVLVDVEMPGLDGVTWARRYHGHASIVFVTAYDRYAVNAFEVDAVDYLVKPVRRERLLACLERVRGRTRADAVTDADGACVTTTGRGAIAVFDARGITRFWSSQKYTMFVADGVEQLTEEPLSALASRLSRFGFVRVRRGELIRYDAIARLESTSDGHRVVLTNGERVRVSRRSVGAVRAAIAITTGRRP